LLLLPPVGVGLRICLLRIGRGRERQGRRFKRSTMHKLKTSSTTQFNNPTDFFFNLWVACRRRGGAVGAEEGTPERPSLQRCTIEWLWRYNLASCHAPCRTLRSISKHEG
jgi:hypothetical protein